MSEYYVKIFMFYLRLQLFVYRGCSNVIHVYVYYKYVGPREIIVLYYTTIGTFESQAI